MSQAKMPDQPMDLNVLVVGGNREDRNLLTTLIADSLHQAGFDDVKRELAGEVDQSSLSVLEVIKDTRPHLFTETIHVSAVSDQGAMIVENDGALTGSIEGHTLMTFSTTRQPMFEPADDEEEETSNETEATAEEGSDVNE